MKSLFHHGQALRREVQDNWAEMHIGKNMEVSFSFPADIAATQ